MSHYLIGRGDIVHVSMDPVVGHEQQGDRPHLVISRPQHQRAFGMVIAVPMTRAKREGWASHIEIEPGSYAICEQPRTFSVDRIRKVESRGLVDKADEVVAIIKRFISNF